jgi:cytosolic carboxypeptidase protein 2/3
VVLVIARQHPCETTGSFIAEYLIKHLLEEGSEVVKHLLAQFEFVIVPMVNPDGVIHGMSRCNMSGLDLNRHWG